MSTRALVTGGSGFIGSRLIALLVASDWDVHVIVRHDSDLARIPQVATIHVDDAVTPLHSIVDRAAPAICIHLAGYFIGVHTDGDVARLISDNVTFGTRLADAVATRGDCVFVNAGSYWQNAGGRDYHPVGLYGATKQALCDVLQFYVESKNLRSATLKFFDTYGLGDTRPKIVNYLLHAAWSGETIGLSPGEQFMDLVHVDDAAAACLAAALFLQENTSPHPADFAVSSGEPVRLRQLVIAIVDIIGRDVPVEWGARDYRWREMMEPWDIAPLVPGWTPKVTLAQGILPIWHALNSSESDR